MAPTTTVFVPCTDSDGGEDINVKGTAARGSESGTDGCEGAAMLREYYCSGNVIGMRLVECPLGCSDGRCLGCEDSDGGDDPDVYGEVTLGTTLRKKDTCSNRDGVTLTEFYCAGNTVASRQVTCPTSCDGGYCN
jgi:hypothetical protein